MNLNKNSVHGSNMEIKVPIIYTEQRNGNKM